MIMVIGTATSIFFGWRYAELSRTVRMNRAALEAHLQNVGDSTQDPSARIARVVEDDEQLFYDTLTVEAAKRTSGIVSLIAVGVVVLATIYLFAARASRASRF